MTESIEHPNLNSIEQVALIQCVRDSYRSFGSKTVGDLAVSLVALNKSLHFDDVRNCLQGRSVSKIVRLKISIAAAVFISNHIDNVKSMYGDSKDSFEFLCKIISKVTKKPVDSSEQRQIKSVELQRDMFRNWIYKTNKASLLIDSGIYQVIRRYKPILGENEIKTEYDWTKAENHAVIFELLRIDSTKQICTLYSSEGNIFNGTFFLNHRNVVAMILQRKSFKGFHHRYITFKAEQAHSKIYAGISVKIGDTTYRPIASECFFIAIPKEPHSELYQAFDEIKTEVSETPYSKNLSREIIENYTSSNPPNLMFNPNVIDPTWRRVKFVREFPSLVGLVKENYRVPLFREPLRVMQDESMRSAGIFLEVFQQMPSKS